MRLCDWLGDWLFARKRAKELPQEFERMMREYESSPLPEGLLDGETGGVTCPTCGHELSLTESLEFRESGAVGATVCPKCRKRFKQH